MLLLQIKILHQLLLHIFEIITHFLAICFCHPIYVFRLSMRKLKKYEPALELEKEPLIKLQAPNVSFRNCSEHIKSFVFLNSSHSTAD